MEKNKQNGVNRLNSAQILFESKDRFTPKLEKH